MSSGLKIDPAVEMLHLEFQQSRLFGEVTVKYEAGRVVLMKKSETIKPATEQIRAGEDEEMKVDAHNSRRN
jgi:hypothetical protein